MDRAATKNVTCEECIEVLADYLEGSMDKATHLAFEAHFADCTPCLDFLQTYKTTIVVTQRVLTHEEEIPEPVRLRLREFLRKNCKKA